VETKLAEPHPADEPTASLVSGIVLIAAGIFAISFSVFSSLISVLVLGVLLIGGGGVAALLAAQRRRLGRGVAQLLSGILAFTAGIFFVLQPRTSVRTIAPVLLFLFLADGLFMVVSTVRRRDSLWIAEVIVGSITFSLGLLLAYEWYSPRRWPVEMWLVGTLTGIHLLNRGVLFIVASAQTRAPWLHLHGRERHV
jgi:uncharacterized membrane protein HdeD (DUF308 family)